MDIFLLWWEDATKRKLNEKWHNTKQCFFLSPKKKFFFLWYTNEGKFTGSLALSGTKILYTFSFIHSYQMKGTSYEHVL